MTYWLSLVTTLVPTLLLFTLFSLSYAKMTMVGGFLYGSFVLVALVRRSQPLLILASLFLLHALYSLYRPSWLRGVPSIHHLAPALACLAMFWKTKISIPIPWRGKLDRLSWFLTFATSLGSVGALYLWASWTDNLGAGAKMIQPLLSYSPLVLFAVFVPIFALVNAISEELFFRGILQTGLEQAIENRWLVIVLQASAFAAAHYAFGFPNGIVGYVMVFFYGGMLGYLKERTGGMLAPILAHIVADAAIALLLYKFATS